jgi:uncharacterized protein (DUF362 family)
MKESFLLVMKRYFKVCKKSGNIVGLKLSGKKNILIFPVIGILALVWFLMRTGTKPSRAIYPCQRIAAGIGVTFLTFIFGSLGSLACFKALKGFFKKLPRAALIAFLILCVGAGIMTATVGISFTSQENTVYADWNPGDPPNSPMGTAKGIHPGRVVWAHDRDATAGYPSGYWYEPENGNQEVVNQMFSNSINTLTGESDNSAAWDAIFRYFNENRGKGNVGYVNGETIAIKINTVNTNFQNKDNGNIDASKEVLLALVEQLVTRAGVPQENIVIYDGGCGTIGSYIVTPVLNVYPDVRFEAAEIWGPIAMVQWVEDAITYSGYSEASPASRRVVRSLYEADYFINLANLKKHEHETAVTLCGKNHFGTMENCEDIHTTINDYLNGMGTYSSLVDLLGHREIGGKTLLFIIDGLWGAPGVLEAPVKWTSDPFIDDWPSSVFMSQDGVAIDSVGLDFLNAEWTLWDNADNYLHEAALADSAPSGIYYFPENDGTMLESLGVHEHWNNPVDKQYSRNLGTENGIELIDLESGPALPEESPEPTMAPTPSPTSIPTIKPTPTPTENPDDTPVPTIEPTPTPTENPDDTPVSTIEPTPTSTENPDDTPVSTIEPTPTSTSEPTMTPWDPFQTPTSTPEPTMTPWDPFQTPTPTPEPTMTPTSIPTSTPTSIPTLTPTSIPTLTPAPTPVGDCNVSFNPANSTQDLNSTFQIDVVVDSGNQELAAYGFTITYNADVLSVVNVEEGADGFLAAANTENPGEIVVSGFEASGTGPGSHLQVLIITFNATAEGTSALGLYVDQLVDADINTIGTACGNDGSVEVITDVMLGDTNGDGGIDIVDALLTAQYYVGLDPAGFIPENADTNCDGSIDIVDALLIAQYYVGLVNEFC